MLRKLLSTITALALLVLSGCGVREPVPEGLTVTCTTYPVYLMAQAVLEGTDTLTPELLIQQEVSCLHNYTLTINDMKKLERASLVALSGVELEAFLEDALEGRDFVDCSEGVELLCPDEDHEEDEDEDHDDHDEEGDEDHDDHDDHDSHDHHDHHGHHHDTDPHYWLAPHNAAFMASNLAEAFGELDPDHAERYAENAKNVSEKLAVFEQELTASVPADCPRELITFHDGFGYFAQTFGFDIVAAVEEEEGSEASARRIRELVELIDQYHLPAIFVEANGSDTTAQCLARERGSAIGVLSMGMSRQHNDLTGLEAYEALIQSNLDTILEVYA